MNLKEIHKDICRMCGVCCFLDPDIKIAGNKFIPTAHIHKMLLEEDKILLGYSVCEHLDLETRKCKNYENRPIECRKYSCKGDPHPQRVIIEGTRND